jgi:anti-sigma B factor antagonist/stage II sporulation protein AA (anti-sigma F factor antagonist)
MEYSSRRYADAVVAIPMGRIDHANADAFKRSLDPDLREGHVVLDLAGVEYISSVGLRVLMIAAKELHAKERKLAVAALQPVVAEIISISRFDRILNVFPSVRVALGALSAPAQAAYDAAAQESAS